MMAEYICYGVLYLAEAMIAWLYLDAQFCHKASAAEISISFLIGYGILFSATWFGSVIINSVAFLGVNLLLAWKNFRCTLRLAALHSAFLTSLMAITEVVAAWVISLFGFPFGAYAENLSVMVVMAVISKLLYFFITVIASRTFAANRSSQDSPAMIGLLGSLPLLSIVISTIVVFVGIRTEMTPPAELLMITIVLTLLAVNLIFIFIYNQLQHFHTEHMAQNLSIQRQEADAVYYQDLQKQYETQRILIHDIKNHLSTLHALAVQSNAAVISEYIAKLGDSILPTRQIKLCSDPVLNFMLLQFQEKCIQKDISFQCDIREQSLTFMDAPSITTFYGNLLTNAMEAAEASEEKWIELSVVRSDTQQIVIISVINSCDTAPIPLPNGLFHTRKKNPEIHGVGLKSIQRIVEQYHGVSAMRFDPKKRCFFHVIQFPL